MKAVLTFFYQLFFTRDDDLDLLQVLFAVIILTTLHLSWVVGTATDIPAEVKKEALITLRWLAGLLVATAVPKWLVPFMLKAKKDAVDESLEG